jgi:hypothetical protein
MEYWDGTIYGSDFTDAKRSNPPCLQRLIEGIPLHSSAVVKVPRFPKNNAPGHHDVSKLRALGPQSLSAAACEDSSAPHRDLPQIKGQHAFCAWKMSRPRQPRATFVEMLPQLPDRQPRMCVRSAEPLQHEPQCRGYFRLAPASLTIFLNRLDSSTEIILVSGERRHLTPLPRSLELRPDALFRCRHFTGVRPYSWSA